MQDLNTQTNHINRLQGAGFRAVLAALILLVTVGSGNIQHTGMRSVNSRLMAAGAERVMPVASATNFVATALAIRHWDKQEVTVHVTASPNDNKTPEQVAALSAQGIKLWNDRIGKIITLKMTDSADADVTVKFVQAGTLPGGAVGQTDVVFNPEDAQIARAAVQINERIGKAQFVQVIAHEMGHALGIQGHSTDKRDLMYPYAHLPVEVTDRDLNTLTSGYVASASPQTQAE